MRKLLSADFIRLFKSKEFYIMGAIVIIISCIRAFDIIVEDVGEMSDGLWIYAVFMGIVMACFIGLFTGTEHSSNTIRNKLITGHRRRDIYLSDYIVCTVSGSIFCLCSIIITYAAIVGKGVENANMDIVISEALLMFFINAAYSAVFVMVSMLNTQKAAAAVISIILALFLLIAGIGIQEGLLEPQKVVMIYPYPSDEDEITSEMFEDNTRYVAGIKRKVYNVINDTSPAGQSIQTAGMFEGGIQVRKVIKLAAYDIIIILFLNSAGIFIFKKKDIK